MDTKHLRYLCGIAALAVLSPSVRAQGTAFTYQGRLNDGANSANGSYDLRFAVFNAASGPSQVGSALTNAATPVSNGLFTVTVDFGPGVFTGANRWLEIAARTNGPGAFTTLAPRQPLLPTPYAIYSGGAASAASAGSVPASGITGFIQPASIGSGTITAAMLASNAVSRLSAPDGSPTNALTVSNNGLVGIGTGTNNLAAGLQITTGADVTTLTRLSQIRNGTLSFTNLEFARMPAVSGNLLAVSALGDSAVTLVNIANPSDPLWQSQVRHGSGVFNNLSGAVGLAWAGPNLVVAAHQSSAVTVISAADPASPVKLTELRDGVGGWNNLNGAYSVAVSGNLLAIGAFADNAVTLADISNPSSPILRAAMVQGALGFTNLLGVTSVAFSGNLLAIAAFGSHAVTLVDISDPANPQKRAELRHGVSGFLLEGASSVALSGNLMAIAAENSDTVTLVDVSNPASPVKRSELVNGVGGYRLDRPDSVAFSDNRLAIAAFNSAAITLVDVGNPADPILLATATDGVNGMNHLAGASGVTFAGTNLVAAGLNDHAFTVLGPGLQQVGLSSAGWVGIGVTQPVAPLHVSGDVVVEKAGLFDVNATRVELGYLTTASGLYSTAMGAGTTAHGVQSTAMGSLTMASGLSSVAMGGGTTASGDYSTATGQNTTARGYYSTAMGRKTLAEGSSSTALGYRAKALHNGSFVWADEQETDFNSSADNQFNIRAAGGVRLNNDTRLNFGNQTRQMLNLWNAEYGIGVQGDAQYFRTGNDFHWYRGGSHSDVNGDGGGGSTLLMTLSRNGRIGLGNTTPSYPLDVQAGQAVGRFTSTNTVNGSVLSLQNTTASPTYLGAINFETSNDTPGQIGYLADGQMAFRAGGQPRMLLNGGGLTVNGTFVSTSDRNVKEDFAAVDPQEVLAKVASLPLQSWSYTNRPGVKHVGPMAQDFRAAFGLGEDDKHIATVDADGVALAAIQGLNQKLEETRAENAELKASNLSLAARLERLEKLLTDRNEKR